MSQREESNDMTSGAIMSADDSKVFAMTASLYKAMSPQAELSSKSTFSLLSSLTLIGLSLASTKPQSVDVLGFTIQADHWLLLAVPLALVVLYSVVLLVLAWEVEKRRYKYVVNPIQIELNDELNRRLLCRRVALEARMKAALNMTMDVSRQDEQDFIAKWENELLFLKKMSGDALLPPKLSFWMSILGLVTPLLVATSAFVVLGFMAL